MSRMSSIFIIILSYISIFIDSQSINYEEACTKIYYSSKKDCTVAPWENNRRCCYISYIENGVRKGECTFVEDTKKALKARKNDYSNSGKSRVKIECNSSHLKKYINKILALTLFFTYLL